MVPSSQRLAVVPGSADPDEFTLVLAGELDAYSVRTLVAELDMLRENGRLHVRLDMSGVTFVDSAGLHALVEQDQVLRRHGGRLVLERPAHPVRRVLSVADANGDLSGLSAE